MKTLRASLAAILVAALLSVQSCHPQPVPSDGGASSTPASWTDTAHTVLDVLGWAIPAARLVIAAWTSTAPEAVTSVLNAVDIVSSTTLPGFSHALDAYEHAGGDRCAVRAAGNATVASLIAVTDTSGAAGWGLAAPIHTALSSLGAIVDVLAPACAGDGGLTAGVSADARINAALAARPATLRPFAEIRPPVSADAGH